MAIFNIKNIKGDVIASEKQAGGFTGKIIYKNSFFSKYKNHIIIAVIILIVGIIEFIANLTTVLNFFNIKIK